MIGGIGIVELFIKILNLSLTGGIMIIAVIALRAILSHHVPRWTICMLWIIAAIRLLCPVSVSIPMSVHSVKNTDKGEEFFQIIEENRKPEISFDVNDKIDRNTEEIKPYISYLYAERGIKLWLVGTAVMLLYAIISNIRLRKRLKDSVLLRNNIFICDNIKSPFLFGLFDARIYIPADLDEENIEYVVSHEKVHLQRLDNWQKLIGFIVLSIYWFNPIVWIGFILFCRDIEYACDERVIKNYSLESKKSYSEVLLKCSIPQHKLPVSFGEIGIKERIKNILNYKKKSVWSIAAVCILCIAFAVCFMTKNRENKSAYYKQISSVTTEKENGISIKKVKNYKKGGIAVFISENNSTAKRWLCRKAETEKDFSVIDEREITEEMSEDAVSVWYDGYPENGVTYTYKIVYMTADGKYFCSNSMDIKRYGIT